jgi:glycosyltransferase involved in cell wall biosynthesis
VAPRVLHVSQPVDAGVARCVTDLVRDQAARGWDVAVACPDGPLAGAARMAGASVLRWPARRSPGPWVAVEAGRLHRLLPGFAPDLVHLHSSKAGLAGRLVLRGRRPTVFQPHAWSFLALEGPTRRAAVAWERRAARWADRVVCVSDGERAVGEREGIGAAYAVVPNGIDLEEFPEAKQADRDEARERLGLGTDETIAVCVGRLSRQKGQDVLLEAWPEVRREVDATVVLVGAGPAEEELRQRAGEGVRFAGASSEVRTWLLAADLVVAPSRWEALSYVLLEAMACDRRIVATDVPGVRETLGEEGRVVPPGDAHALAEAVVAALSDPQAPGGRAVVEAQHDVRVATQAIAGLYADVLDGRTSQ